jgi:phage terminase Nu1 subunit (DNA packaging protein)
MEKTDHTTIPDDGITDAQREARSANAAKATEARKAAAEARRVDAAITAAAAVAAAGIPPIAVSEARLMAAKAEIAELDAAERRGELIAVDKARADVDDLISTARTKILGVPSRLAQRDRTITPAQVELVEALIREALSELADGDDDDG